MAASVVLGPRRWYFDLSGRDRDYRLFLIPREIVDACGVTWNSKRRINIVLNTGQRLEGFCTITSGTELSIPTHLQGEFRQANWFVCEIVGDETADAVTLDRVGQGV
jgi:hypothetical protein